MTTVEVTGLPKCKQQKLIFIFKQLLHKNKSWTITEMADIRGTDLMSVNVRFRSFEEASTAAVFLDGYLFHGIKDKNKEYILKAQVVTRGSQSPYRCRSRGIDVHRDSWYEPRRYSRDHSRSPIDLSWYEHRRYSRDRSPSPFDLSWYDRRRYSQDRSYSPIDFETSRLDVEIEMLRKRRLIVEEERRLLIERKKLELLKEFGPNALNEFDYTIEGRERERDRRYRAARRSPERRRSPPHRRPRLQKRDKIPRFLVPIKILLDQMMEQIKKLTDEPEIGHVISVIRNTIRKRLVDALEGKPIMSAAKVVELYRANYPQNLDDDFIKSNIKHVRSRCKSNKHDTDKKAVESSKVEEENIEAKDNQETGEPSNMESCAVKSEPVETAPSDIVNKGSEDREESKEIEAASVDSSEALALHDKNDEDWAEGVHSWTDDPQETEGK